MGDSVDAGRAFLGLGLLSRHLGQHRQAESLAVRALEASLPRTTESGHAQAVAALVRMLGEAAVIDLLKWLAYSHPTAVESAAIRHLGEIKSEQAARTLIGMIGYQTFEVDIRRAMGAVGEAAVDPLAEALSSPGAWFREQVARALGEVGSTRAARVLIHNALLDRVNEVFSAAQESLWRIGEPAVLPLIDALHEDDNVLRGRVAGVLGLIGDPRALPALVDVLRDSLGPPMRQGVLEQGEDATVRFSVVLALGHLGDERGIEALIQALTDSSFKVREIACWALGKIGDERALEPLEAAALDANGDVRAAAERAITSLLGTPGEPSGE